jgi:hypothetical protein
MKSERKLISNSLELLILAAFFTLLFIYTFRPNWDIDIFWHMATGQWILNNGALPSTDIFSATDKARDWTTFQWLYEVITYEINSRLGFTTIRLMHSILYMLTFAGLYATYRKYLNRRTIALTMLMLTLVLSEDRFRVRPEAFNFLFTAIILPVLLECAFTLRKRPKTATIAMLVIVAALWANIHAGGALTLMLGAGAMFGGSLLQRLIRPDDQSKSRLSYSAWVLAAAALPMLPMPGFIQGNWTAFTMVNQSTILIPEWHPPAAYFLPAMGGKLTDHNVICGVTPYLIFGWALMAAALGFARLLMARQVRVASAPASDGTASAFAARIQAAHLGLLTTAVFFAVLPVKSARFIYMSAFAVLFLIYARKDWWLKILDHQIVRMCLMILAVLLGMSSYQNSVATQRGGLTKAITLLDEDLEPETFPTGASDAIAAMGLQGRIFHFTSWGGYLIGRHFPECDVFTDGRGNFTIDERDALIETHQPWQREIALEKAWQKYPFEIVVYPKPVFPLLKWDTSKWMLIYRDEIAEVFLRVSPDNQANIGKATAWWKAAGVSYADTDALTFQDDYRRALGFIALKKPKTDKRLANAASRAKSDSLPNRVSGLYDGALILFDAGLYEKSAKFFKMILDEGIRHSTAALYLAWTQYLDDDPDAARATLMKNFASRDILEQPDRGPLKWGGKKILDELGGRLGLKKAEAANPQ